jgi:uncharacterized protein
MGIVLKTLSCNGLCGNCYENKIRSTAGPVEDLNLDKALDLIRAEAAKPKNQRCNAPCLHGGEPLLLPIDKIERFLGVVFDGWGQTSVQTNGTILTAPLIELFKRYKTNIGVSIDGDTAALNRGRWNAGGLTDEQIQKKTDLVIDNIRTLRDAGISVSVIALLRRHNATAERIDNFIRFLRRMGTEFGIRDIRTNPVIGFIDEFKDEELKPVELEVAYSAILDALLLTPGVPSWLPYRDIIDLTMGHRNATCNFIGCDPWHTISEQPISAAGYIGTCLKVGGSQDGVFSMSADCKSFEREKFLRQLPMAENGCSGCRYWIACHGGCPGEGADGDYRNHSRFCGAIQGIFSYAEYRLKLIFPNLKTAFDFGAQGSVGPLRSISKSAWQRQHAMTDAEVAELKAAPAAGAPTGGHGDSPHGDSHGDHLDKGGVK